MNNYEKINTYLKHGLCVSVKDIDGEYQIISTMEDEDGDYRAGSLYSTLEEAKQNIREGHCYSNEELEEFHKDWTDITPFHLDFEPYPLGMKVTIKNGGVKEIQVRNSAGYYCKNLARMFAHHEIIPYFEEPTTTLTDEELLAECERRAISTKITK